MAQYISVSSRWGDFAFDLDQPLLFKDRLFPTYEQACVELATLDERCYPLLRQADSGEWAILVHCQERLNEQKPPWYRRFKDRNLEVARFLAKGVWKLAQIGSAAKGLETVWDLLHPRVYIRHAGYRPTTSE